MRSLSQRCLVICLIVSAGVWMFGQLAAAKAIRCTAVKDWAEVLVHSSSDVSVDEGDQTCTFTIDHATESSHERAQVLSRYAARIARRFGFFTVADPRENGTPENIFYQILPLILAAPKMDGEQNADETIKKAIEFVASNESFFKECIGELHRFRTSEEPPISPLPGDNMACSPVQEGYFVFAMPPLRIYFSHRPWGWERQQFYEQLHQQSIVAIAESPDISMTDTEIEEIIEQYKRDLGPMF